ncbi:ABC transporter ATP-binding protein [Staphylococcus intermedius]|uniref:Carnitine transport ATP-binding protein OpuCA n=1 Tax=Staphylococcus intermedius NCTC 11048 TaxID=1141106 RepID=A0A380G8T6_STAIN|nr:ABC transporter ATP-binding protein [Staphylococcus intermedius]PCF65473.1 glycine/betaine ABC transporter ATP-binding protein [Staphylococcus intermedius]PCF81151.1 glycine/betaine ABC transporter ATP-binding protein [Staphylococcus intermedius]PCF82433.1 glycine/betaine ABC transporter ATP-binding protein [Staphylococcus intermedius]PCF87133.1 glycine/betaine ABC transporter ATP-binding protein [Staphylococcus intermedius]PCF87692.1 glycine/betaine ABC transporter ATP-binding protein [Sta
MIKFSNVSKRYGDRAVVNQVDMEINEGEFFVLIGPSGSGKTTTMKMINRLIPLSEGYIYFKNRPISDYSVYEMRWDMGYVLQQIALFPHMTIRDNIAQVPLMKGWSKEKIDARVDELLSMVGLEPEQFRNRKPEELSGGQRQRVGVVRALAVDPPVILMDEPFSALDPITREKLQDDLLKLQDQIKKTIVFVTHDIEEAFKLGDRICLLNHGQVEQIGTPNDFIKSPKNDFVCQFLGDLTSVVLNHFSLGKVVEIVGEIATEEQLSQYPVVHADQTVSDVYDALVQHEAVIVPVEGEQWSLSRQDIFSFLSKNQAGETA